MFCEQMEELLTHPVAPAIQNCKQPLGAARNGLFYLRFYQFFNSNLLMLNHIQFAANAYANDD